MWEKDININEVKEIRTRTTVYFGVGAIKKIDDIAKVLKEKGIDCKVVPTPVTDKAYCGVCIETYADNVEQLINDMEHRVVE